MGNEITATKQKSGMFVSGLVISSGARLRRRNDGSGSFVIVTHEIATQPGVVEYSQFLDVGKDPGLKVQGDEVLEYPKLSDMKPVSLKVLAWKVNDKKFIVTRGELTVA